MTTPRVSVLVPTWNGAAHLAETLRSALDQTWGDFELLVVDDASADSTLEIARSATDPRVRVLPHDRRLGIPGNWNRALGAARAPLVKYLFQDDLLFPHALERLVSALDAVPEATVAFGRREIRHEGGGDLPLQGDVYTRALGAFYAGLDGPLDGRSLVRAALAAGRDLTFNVVGEPSFALYRRDAMARAGGFDRHYRQLVDWDLSLRLARAGPLVFVDDVLGVFRVHEGGQSATNHRTLRTRFELLRLLAMVSREYGPDLTPGERRQLSQARWRMRTHVVGETLRQLR
jgi:glycosyltransferase involved in cell wall biosynthesis